MKASTNGNSNGNCSIAMGKTEMVAVDLIDPSPLNPRQHFDPAELQELADSYRSVGVLQPVVVRPAQRVVNRGPLKGAYERYELVAGERRWRAAQLAGLKEIPATIRELDDKQVLEIALIENGRRKDLGAIEKAKCIKQLLDDHGYTAEDVAKKTGQSVAGVYGLLKLLNLPAKAAQAVAAGELPATTAQLIARIPGEKARSEVAKFALTKFGNGETPSLRDVKDRIRHRFMIELKQAPFDTKDAALVPTAGACTTCPHRTGNNRAEYPDSRADICTNPDCYSDKSRAVAARQANDKGHSLVPAAQARKLFRYGNHVQAWGTPWVNLADSEYRNGKRSTYEQLLKPHLDPAEIYLAIGPDGTIYRMVKRDQAEKLLAKHHKKMETRFSSSSRPKSKAERKAESEKHRVEREVRKEVLRRVMVKAEGALFVALNGPAGAARCDALDQVLTPLCGVLEHLLYGSDVMHVAEVAEVLQLGAGKTPPGKEGAVRKRLIKSLPSLSLPQRFGLLALVVFFEDEMNRYEDSNSLLAALGIDKAQIEEQVKHAWAAPAAAPAPHQGNGKLPHGKRDLDSDVDAEQMTHVLYDSPRQHTEDEVMADDGFCHGCGCTEDEPCEGGCYWVEPGLCSTCVAKGWLPFTEEGKARAPVIRRASESRKLKAGAK